MPEPTSRVRIDRAHAPCQRDRMASPRRTVLIPTYDWEPFSQMRMGVLRYAREHARWRLEQLPKSLPPVFAGLSQWSGDGAILTLRTVSHLRLAKRLPYPVVNVSAFVPGQGLPRVRPDDVAVGRLGADHLCSLGLRHLLFCGEAGFFQMGERQAGFTQRAREDGITVRVHTVTGPCGSWDEWQATNHKLDHVLQQMPQPFGVLAANDSLAQRVLIACDRLGLSVPGEVAVVGVDNVEPICRYADPPLTSIDRNMEQVGFEAARLLDRLMAGQSPPKGDVVLPPRGLIKRRSSDTIGFSDPDVRAVITYMRTHLHEVFGVERLVPLVAISRRGLERNFRQQVGSTLHDYLSRLRIERCMEVLAEDPSRSAKHLAEASGFSSAKRLALVFRRITGGTIEEYRHGLDCAVMPTAR